MVLFYNKKKRIKRIKKNEKRMKKGIKRINCYLKKNILLYYIMTI